MAATVEQAFEGARRAADDEGDPISEERVYLVFDAEDEAEAVAAVAGEAPETVDEMPRTGIDIDSRLGPREWRVRVSYAAEPESDEDDADDPNGYTFETGGGTRHVSVALEHVATYPAGAAKFGGAINVDADGGVGGVDVVMPQPGFSETVALKKSQFNAKYKRALIYLTGKVNAAKFRGFQKGEVRFDGASATRVSKKLYQVTYRYSVSENRRNFECGGIEIGEKYGWDYLWFRYMEAVSVNDSGTPVAIVKKPVSAHVERVYEFADFGIIKGKAD